MTEQLKQAAQAALNACERIVDQEDSPVQFGIDFRALGSSLRRAITTSQPAQAGEVDGVPDHLWPRIIKGCVDNAEKRRASLPTQPAAQEVDDGDVTGQPGPLPETGWDEVPEGAFRKPSPTAGMNLGERIKHVGGRENAAGYIEFGSVAAVRALVRQYLRDLPAPQQATPEPVGGHDMAVMLARGAKAWAGVDPQDLRAGGTPEPVLLNGLTEAETNATASVMGLTATPPQQAAGGPVGRCLTEEEQARTTLRDPVVWFGGAPRGKTLYTHPAPGVPAINYDELIRAAFAKNRKWAQGTNGCVAFAKGAEWFRDLALAAAQAKGGEHV